VTGGYSASHPSAGVGGVLRLVSASCSPRTDAGSCARRPVGLVVPTPPTFRPHDVARVTRPTARGPSLERAPRGLRGRRRRGTASGRALRRWLDRRSHCRRPCGAGPIGSVCLRIVRSVHPAPATLAASVRASRGSSVVCRSCLRPIVRSAGCVRASHICSCPEPRTRNNLGPSPRPALCRAVLRASGHA
jgi:hypothetical protein